MTPTATAPSTAQNPVSSPAARRVSVAVNLEYAVAQSTDVMLQIGIGAFPGQEIRYANYFSNASLVQRDAPSVLAWAHVDHNFSCGFEAEVDITRDVPDISQLQATPVAELPDDVLHYLVASRYCPSDEFHRFVNEEFGNTFGGVRVQQIVDWVQTNLVYESGSSNVHTTALDTFVAREGVCRDYAHLVITLARASTIPARIASVYGLGVTPQDFHAVAEVYLDGAWYLVDATGMTTPDRVAQICSGRDAADVAFMTIYGGVATLLAQQVTVR